MSLGSGALPASGHHSAMLTVLGWMRVWSVTQVPPERPSIFTTSDLPKQSSKCPVGSHFREFTLSCRVKGGRESQSELFVFFVLFWGEFSQNKPGRQTELQAAHSHRSPLWPRGFFRWGSPLQKACPHCARRHTGELGEIRGEDL